MLYRACLQSNILSRFFYLFSIKMFFFLFIFSKKCIFKKPISKKTWSFLKCVLWRFYIFSWCQCLGPWVKFEKLTSSKLSAQVQFEIQSNQRDFCSISLNQFKLIISLCVFTTHTKGREASWAIAQQLTGHIWSTWCMTLWFGASLHQFTCMESLWNESLSTSSTALAPIRQLVQQKNCRAMEFKQEL
jgi:hypothetical protein